MPCYYKQGILSEGFVKHEHTRFDDTALQLMQNVARQPNLPHALTLEPQLAVFCEKGLDFLVSYMLDLQ